MDAPAPTPAPGPRRRIRDYFRRYQRGFFLGVLFLIATQALALSVPRLLRRAADSMLAHDFDEVKRVAAILAGVAVAGALVRIASRLLIFNSGRRVEFDLRNDLFAHLCRFPPSYFQKLSTGQIMSRAVNDLTQIRLLLGPGLLNLTNTLMVYLVVVPLLFMTDAELAFYSLLVVPALLQLGRLVGKKMYDMSHESQEKLGELSTRVQENLAGAMTIRAYRREADEERAFARANDEYVAVNLKLAKLRGGMFPLMGLLGAFGSIVLLWLGGRRMIEGQLTVGQFVEFNAYLAALTWPTLAFGWIISIWQRGLASMDRLNEVFTAEVTIGDGPLPAPRADGERRGARVEIKDLTFRYGEATRPALADVSCTFEPGETVVIVGRTGSGKSTMLRAIARLLEIPRGTVFLDGQDVVDLPLEAVRGSLAYAPQEAFLFSRTIHENVAFGRPDAARAEVESAVRSAGLDTDVGTFPEGLETIVGERGITLSGGQRQRAALARALLVAPRILLLDDTLAAVDTETEQRILGELAHHAKNRTTILVTHRLACAALADRILVMEGGRIVEQGSEAELLAKNGVYAAMHRRQRIREELESEARQKVEALAS